MDPYLYENPRILKNKLNIRNINDLEEAEANYVAFRLKEVTVNPLKGDYSYQHFLEFHKFLFQDLYEWAGVQRKVNIEKQEPILGEMSIEYSDVFDVSSDATRILKEMSLRDWKEMSKEEFVKVFADDKGFPLNRKLFEKHSEYVRTALVAYNAYFTDGVDVSKKEYLENFIADALN